MIRRGQEGEYRWVETRLPESAVGDIVIPLHAGCRLAVVAFDGGPGRPIDEEQEGGWSVVGGVRISPPLETGVEVGESGADEWCVLDALPPDSWTPESFVGIGSFTLAPVSELVAAQDPTWDRRGWDWLIPLQERFWDQLVQLQPVTYVVATDCNVTVVRGGRAPVLTMLNGAGPVAGTPTSTTRRWPTPRSC